MVRSHGLEVREGKNPKPEPERRGRDKAHDDPRKRHAQRNIYHEHSGDGTDQREGGNPVPRLLADDQAPARWTRPGAIEINDEKSASWYAIAAMGTRGVPHRRITD